MSRIGQPRPEWTLVSHQQHAVALAVELRPLAQRSDEQCASVWLRGQLRYRLHRYGANALANALANARTDAQTDPRADIEANTIANAEANTIANAESNTESNTTTITSGVVGCLWFDAKAIAGTITSTITSAITSTHSLGCSSGTIRVIDNNIKRDSSVGGDRASRQWWHNVVLCFVWQCFD